MMSALEKVLMMLGRGVGKAKVTPAGELPGLMGRAGMEGMRQAGSAIKANPGTAALGAAGGAAGLGLYDAMSEDEDEDEMLKKLLQERGMYA